eukprot:gene5752-5993_t
MRLAPSQLAKFLSWVHLTREQIAAIRAAPVHDGALTARQFLQQYVCEQLGDHQLRNDIILDLYSYTLKQGQAWGLGDEQLSCLFGLVKEVHSASVGQRLTVERSFDFFKDTLFNHSIQRPPFSIGVFTPEEMRAILDWMLHTYYQHYKLYQYAFVKRITLSLTSYQPTSLVELVPILPPLAEALTEEQHQQELDEQQRQFEEACREQAAAAAAVAEEARIKALQDEYEASLPDDIKEKVLLALEREVAYLKDKMEQQFQAQQAQLLTKLGQLETAARRTSKCQ